MPVNINITEHKYAYLGPDGKPCTAKEFASRYPGLVVGGHRPSDDKEEDKGTGAEDNKS